MKTGTPPALMAEAWIFKNEEQLGDEILANFLSPTL